MTVYLNGSYIEERDARISPFDRGFQFADGVYEVIRAYEGRFFRADSHLRRLRRSLAELRIDLQGVDDLLDVATTLVDRNGYGGRHCKCYIQVTRGVAPRSHRFPRQHTTPTVFASVTTIDPPAEPEEVAVILTEDTRWGRRDIKSIMLLSNVLASQAAAEADADEALLVDGDVITEGAHTGFAAVRDGTLYTHPAGRQILPSITREVVLEICAEVGIPVLERAVRAEELHEYEELMILGTTSEVSAVTRVDGRKVQGPGPVIRRLQEEFQRKVRRELGL